MKHDQKNENVMQKHAKTKKHKIWKTKKKT